MRRAEPPGAPSFSMRVVITGAAGLVGSALADTYRNHDVFALRHDDLDITDARAVHDVVRRLTPEIMFNCAVIGVDECETNPLLAEQVNVDGPMHLATAAEVAGAAIVHFSTNYVFDGDRTDGVPYTIGDEARPINVYGATKLRGELAVSAAARRAFIVRTSWVFGAGKNNFLSTVGARLARGEPVQAITDTFASTTYVNDLTARVADVVTRGEPGTYQIVNEGICSYETFAIEAARILGIRHRLIETTTEAAMARAARRPRWTPMRCDSPPMRPWQDALREFLGR
jgi:dTDP-4-dehydrorhamnose reductase